MLVAALAILVIAVATLVGVGWNSSDSIGPAVDVPDSVTPIPGLEVSVDLPNGAELPNGTLDSPDGYFGLRRSLATRPTTSRDRPELRARSLQRVDLTSRRPGNAWLLPRLEQDRTDGGCNGPHATSNRAPPHPAAREDASSPPRTPTADT